MPFIAGLYEIRSLVEEEPIVGISPPLAPLGGPGPVILYEPVRLNGSGVWRITQKGDSQFFQFSIYGFEYTGISDKKVVIATNTAFDNRLWYIKPVRPEIYIIALADDESVGWTVDGLGPDANIVVNTLPPPNVENETLPNPYYHEFKISGLLPK